jgi:hypothetical protein
MITFIQEGAGWDCLVSDRVAGRIVETPSGFELRGEGFEVRVFADLTDAQGAFMDALDPGWRDEDARARADARRRAADPKAPAPAPPEARGKREAKPWHGPKRGTHYARAVDIRDTVHKYDHLRKESRWDHRDRSPAHARAYDLACEAASLFGEAQGLSRHPSLRGYEGKARARARRLLAKAEELMPEILRIDREERAAFMADLERRISGEGPKPA